MSSPKSVVLAVIGLLLPALMLAPSRALAQAQGVRGEASVTTTGGYGRIVIRTAAELEAQGKTRWAAEEFEHLRTYEAAPTRRDRWRRSRPRARDAPVATRWAR